MKGSKAFLKLCLEMCVIMINCKFMVNFFFSKYSLNKIASKIFHSFWVINFVKRFYGKLQVDVYLIMAVKYDFI